MGMWSGASLARVQETPEVEERATYWAPTMPVEIGTYSDVVVNSVSAAQSVAIRSTADLIASLGSELPINLWTEERGKVVRYKKTSASIEDPGGDDRGREDWAYRLFWSWLLAGNTCGDIIERDPYQLLTVDLLNISEVTPTVADGMPKWYVRGKDQPASRMAHWRVNPVPGRLMGLSPIEHHATTIGISLATSRFGRQWFADGAHPSGYLTNSEVPLDETIAADAKAKVLAARGSSEPMVFGKGWGFTGAQVTPEESQFLETQGLSEAQCARIFGPGFAEILGYETGGKMTYANVVDRRQDLLVLSMNRWLRRYDRVLSMFAPRGVWVEVNRDALLEATTLQRYQAHTASLTWRTPNEIRAIEHLDPIAGGDQLSKTPAAPAPTSTGATHESDS